MTDTTIPILYEDGEALVIDKPAGLPIDRPRKGGPCLDDYLEQLKLGFQRPASAIPRRTNAFPPRSRRSR